jgi:hypothetical protein
MFLISGVDFVAPLPRLLIQVSPVGERSPGQEDCLYEPEGTFYPRGAVGIPNRVRYELKTETLSKGRHLGHWNHVAPRPMQHDDMRVIDHYAGRGAGEVTKRFGEKHFAVEALKLRWTPSDKKSAILRWCGGLTKTAAVRPPSIPGLIRRSGRIPALPYPPIKHFDCTAGAVFSKEESIHSGKQKR